MLSLAPLALLAPLLPAPAQDAAVPELPPLAVEDVDAWARRVRPAEEELAYLEIPWIPELAEGLREAERRGKPLLLWLMNGHPLGCT